jgi:cytochrome c oxidase assembly protein subunit 15
VTLAANKGVSRLIHAASLLVFLTAVSGGLVAGLDAGQIYDTWPLMGGALVPSDYVDPRYADTKGGLADPTRNALDNPSAAQFHHRWIAATAALALLAGCARVLRTPSAAASAGQVAKRVFSPTARVAAALTAAAVLGQFTLGVFTVLSAAHVPLAASHQSGSLAVLGFATWLMWAVRKIPVK